MAGNFAVKAAVAAGKAVLRGLSDRNSPERKVMIASTVGLIFGVLLLCVMPIVTLFGWTASSGGNASNLEGNERIVAEFLLAQEVPPIQVAAIMGNIAAESRAFDPAEAELFNSGASEFTSAGQGRGILQWSFYPGRRAQLYSFTGFEGNREALHGSLSRQNPQGSWANLNSQLEFLWSEMTGEGLAVNYTNVQWPSGTSWAGFLTTNNLDDATYYFGRWFVRPADPRRAIAFSEAQRFHASLISVGGGGALLLEGDMHWPVPGFSIGQGAGSRFGWRIHPIHGDRRHHNGVDIPAPQNTPVVAAGNGTVSFVGWRGGYGNTIIIDHGGGITTWYAHLHTMNVVVGTHVAPGDRIGGVGTTGASTGNHLHWEVRVNNNPVDPMTFRSSDVANN